MRRFTLLIAVALMSTMGMAQNRALMVGENPSKGFATKQTQKSATEGTVYWSEDFNSDRWFETVWGDAETGYYYDQDTDLPQTENGEQWTTASIGEQTTNRDAMFFHWSDVGPRGRYTSPDVDNDNLDNSHNPNNDRLDNMPDDATIDNGFIMLEGDYANTTESGQMPDESLVYDLESYIQCGPIDLSEAPGALFNIKQFYRYCCAGAAKVVLEVSVDYDEADPTIATWGEFILSNVTGGNDFTFQNEVHFKASERDMSVNISRMLIADEYVAVAGSDNVYIRLRQYETSHYFWIIDDLSITEPPLNDMVLTDGFADYMYDAEVDGDEIDTQNATNFYGGYTAIPEGVVGPFVKFRAAVVNNGQQNIAGAKANVNITRDGENVYSAEGTDLISIDKYVNDTVRVFTDYTPAEVGNYQALITTTLDGEDGNTDNNSWKYDFKVGGDYWSTVYHGDENLYSTAGPRDWADGGFDGDACANEFFIPEGGDTKIYGINFYFSSHRGRDAELAAIEDGYFAVYGRVWTYDAVLEETVLTTIATPLRTLYIDDTASWITIPFIDDGGLFLETDKSYYVGLDIKTGTTQELRFMLGKDLYGPKQPVEGGYIYLSNNGTWGRTGDNYAIELIMGEEAPVEMKKITFNFDASCTDGIVPFDPENDTIFVSGDWSDYPVPGTKPSTRLYKSITPGSFAGTAQSIEVNKEYTYRYYAGSGLGKPLSDWITVSVEGENVVVDDIRDCNYVGVEENAELNTMDVYPNPFKNTLTITNTVNITNVTISNVVGQTVNEISVDNTMVEISTTDLDAGIYVISVTDANNNVSTQRVVKQ